MCNFYEFALSFAGIIDVIEPNSYKEAISSSNIDQRIGAMMKRLSFGKRLKHESLFHCQMKKGNGPHMNFHNKRR